MATEVHLEFVTLTRLSTLKEASNPGTEQRATGVLGPTSSETTDPRSYAVSERTSDPNTLLTRFVIAGTKRSGRRHLMTSSRRTSSVRSERERIAKTSVVVQI